MEYDNEDYIKPSQWVSQKDHKGFYMLIKKSICPVSHKKQFSLFCCSEFLGDYETLDNAKKGARNNLRIKKLQWNIKI